MVKFVGLVFEGMARETSDFFLMVIFKELASRYEDSHLLIRSQSNFMMMGTGGKKEPNVSIFSRAKHANSHKTGHSSLNLHSDMGGVLVGEKGSVLSTPKSPGS